MGKKIVEKKGRVSLAKKRWYRVFAPLYFQSISLGETLAADDAPLVGRTITISLGTVFEGARRLNFEGRFRIVTQKGNECHTEFLGWEMLTPYVRRLVRRQRKRIDDSFVVETKDQVRVRLKPLILVRGSVQRSKLGCLREGMRLFFAEKVKDLSYPELVQKLLAGELSKELRSALKKVYPVANFEMRALTRETKS